MRVAGWGMKPQVTYAGMLTERTFKGTTQGYGLQFLFTSGSKSVSYVIRKRSDGKYDVLSLKKAKGADGYGPKSTIERRGLMALAPDELFKAIEGIAKENGDLKSVSMGMDDKGFVDLFMRKEGMPTGTLAALFPEIHANLSSHGSQVACFSLIGAEPKDEARLRDIMEKASVLVRKAGFGHLCYGDVIATKAAKRTLLADYSPSTDQIRIISKDKGYDGVRSMIHELGHRQYHKFKADHAVIAAKWREVRNTKKPFSIGDAVQDPKGGVVVITDKSYRAGKYSYVGEYETDTSVPKNKFKLRGIDNWEVVRGQKHDKDPFNVSGYAMTEPGEFWAEVFSFAVMGRDDLMDWVRQVTK